MQADAGSALGERVAGRRATGSKQLDLCLLRRLRDRRDGRLRGGDLRRNDQDAQIRCLVPSFLPGETEARKPKSLAAEIQDQQHSVHQQRQRHRESA